MARKRTKNRGLKNKRKLAPNYSKKTITVDKTSIPPGPTLRYCMECKCNRLFRYDPGPGHSVCDVCGLWKARKPTADKPDPVNKIPKPVRKRTKKKRTLADVAPEIKKIKADPCQPIDNSKCYYNSRNYCTLKFKNVRTQEQRQQHCRNCGHLQ